jgi:hypothetical protein
MLGFSLFQATDCADAASEMHMLKKAAINTCPVGIVQCPARTETPTLNTLTCID